MNNKFFGFGVVSTILALSISSWVLVHILAVFGIFLGIAYPLWWMFAPKQSVCFLCRAQREGTTCSFCRKTIFKNEGVPPKSFLSAFLNGVLILIFSVVSVIMIYGETWMLDKMGFPKTPKTASFIIPPKGQFRVGEIFPMKLEINNLENSINTIQADVGFDPNLVEVVDISTAGSFANVFIQKEINNQGGWARLTGGLPNPGFHENVGMFGTIYFRAKTPGIVRIEFLPTSIVLANDGRGTDILKNFPTISYVILPEKISAEEEEIQQQLIFDPDVLGDSVADRQLFFFEEERILGAEVAPETEDVEETGLTYLFFDTLGKINRRILEFWRELLLFN